MKKTKDHQVKCMLGMVEQSVSVRPLVLVVTTFVHNKYKGKFV